MDTTLESEIAAIRWFHSLKFGGQTTPGFKSREILESEADVIFKHPVEGRSVLDIGSWDGFFSFEAEQRGAARVMSTDYFCWDGPGWGTKDGYNLAHRALNSKCESRSFDVFELNPRFLGTFDVVLFLGVLYHLKNPLEGLERAAAMSHDQIVVETVTAFNDIPEPVFRYYPGSTLAGDASNFFAQNTASLEAMLNELGFGRVEMYENNLGPDGTPRPTPAPSSAPGKVEEGLTRHVVHAWRT